MNLDQLARLLGLSKTTVSRALAGYADVSAATRTRVQDAAATHGYQPNPLAQRLRSGRIETVGLVIPADLGPFGDAFFLDLLTNLSRRLSERRLDLLLTAADPGDAEFEALRRLVEGKRVDGMILVRTLRADPRVGYLLERGTPFVCHGRVDDSRAYAFVDMDGEAAGQLATRRLLELGHRRIGFIGPRSSNLSFAHHRRSGYSRALDEAGLPASGELIREGDQGKAFGRSAAAQLLGLADPPSALVCGTDLEALGALLAIEDAGLSAGRDISVIGHDDLPEASFANPPLTTLRQPHGAIGRRLADMLADLIEGADPRDRQEVWQARLIERSTTGEAPTTR